MGKFYSGIFSFSMFLIISQVTATTTTPPVTVVCSRTISMTVTLVPTAVDLTAFGQHDVVLPPQLILRNTVRGSVCLTTVPQQQQSQSQIPSQAYTNYALGPTQMSFL